jgi:hypothetical protein
MHCGILILLGNYTIWWYWDWVPVVFATCADISVGQGPSSVTVGSVATLIGSPAGSTVTGASTGVTFFSPAPKIFPQQGE